MRTNDATLCWAGLCCAVLLGCAGLGFALLCRHQTFYRTNYYPPQVRCSTARALHLPTMADDVDCMCRVRLR
jgi:hypothetical protein